MNQDFIDDALAHPAPGQIQHFLDHEWVVATRDGQPCVEPSLFWWHTIFIFPCEAELHRFEESHHGKMVRGRHGFSDYTPVHMTGHELFSGLAQRDDYDGILINGDADNYNKPDIRYVLGPNFAANLMRGIDERVEHSPEDCAGQMTHKVAHWTGLVGAEEAAADSPEQMPVILDLCDELLAMIPEGEEVVPREQLRTPRGAWEWREHPYQRTKSWLEEKREEVLYWMERQGELALR